VRVGGVFSVNPDMSPDLILSASFSGGENYYEYSTDTNENLLSRYTLTQKYTIGYKWGDLSVFGYFARRIGWTYRDTRNQAFEVSEELNYSMNKNFTLILGHTNGGAALAANGQDSNVMIINENDSIVYAGLGIAF
jgi:hypothetical protein